MVTFLSLLCILLSAALAYLVWSFWPVLAEDWRAGQRRIGSGMRADLLNFKRELWFKSRSAPPAPAFDWGALRTLRGKSGY